MSVKKATINHSVYKTLAALFIAASVFITALSFMVYSRAKYVTEVSRGGDLPYDLQNPFMVSTQQELFNAIVSGYGYVRLAGGLDAPIIMTGDSLDLKADLTIDLNGNEIQRNNRGSLLRVTDGTTFTVVDTAGGGGLYNPIGSVLTVGAGTGTESRGNGGNLNVFGGTFESGPRPSEYYSNFEDSIGANTVVFEKYNYNGTTLSSGATGVMPILTLRTNTYGSRTLSTGNVYFDKAFTKSAIKAPVPADTYCYMITEGIADSVAYDISDADFVYSYYVNENGVYSGPNSGEKQVKVFGYTEDIAASLESTGTDSDTYPNYSAVYMEGGTLNVDITAQNSSAELRGTDSYGSFYSYFGTWHTSCVYIKDGVMTVSTSGEFATVNPADLPDYNSIYDSSADLSKTAYYGEGACILAAGGTLNIRKLASATSYNGSVISVSGGEVTIKNANLNKYPTISHANSPFNVADEGGEFPANRQYRDAALFVNGGTLNISNSEVKVYKELNASMTKSVKNSSVPMYANGDIVTKASFGILSRGRTGAKESTLIGEGVRILMHGSHSYGIMATRGKVELRQGLDESNRAVNSKIIVDSDNSCYGLYAVNKGVNTIDNKDRVVNVTLNGADIEVGPRNGYSYADGKSFDENTLGTLDTATYVGSNPSDWDWMTGANGQMKPASIGIYLEFTNASAQPSYNQTTDTLDDSDKAQVNIIGASVSSKEIGVAVNGGNLTFSGSGALNAYNASAVALSGGDVEFASGSSYTVKSDINRKDNSLTANDGKESGCAAYPLAASYAATHQYDIFVPWQIGDSYVPWQKDAVVSDKLSYTNVNGIHVTDGNLNAEGEQFDVTFRGLYNDIDDFKSDSELANNTSYINVDHSIIKSFAVSCESGKVNIVKANITTYVGGGVKVAGGNIVLGREGATESNNNDITVSTLGHVHTVTPYSVSQSALYSTWKFFATYSGGHAVIARGGNITINCGTYTAAYGNGVMATNDNAATSTKIIVNNGKFVGNLTHQTNDGNCKSATYDTASGPASNYGLNVMGAATVCIYGGSFDGKNGGGIVRGSGIYSMANAFIYEGLFGSTASQDGFNVYDFGNVYFGAYTKDQLVERQIIVDDEVNKNKLQDLITAHAARFNIAINHLMGIDKAINVYVYYGNYITHTTPSASGSVDNGVVTDCSLSAVDDPKGTYHLEIYGYGNSIPTVTDWQTSYDYCQSYNNTKGRYPASMLVRYATSDNIKIDNNIHYCTEVPK